MTNQESAGAASAAGPRVRLVVLWAARALPLAPVLLVLPAFIAFFQGAPGASQRLDIDAPTILGPAAMLTLAGAFAVGPVGTVTGWRWHLILGRDLGLWTFALAAIDLASAVLTAGSGWLNGIGGTAFLAAGTAATLLMVPLALTSNRVSMRLLGRQWKRLHRLTYPVVAMVVVHLFFIGGLALAVILFGPSTVLRIPAVRRRVVARRRRQRAGRRRLVGEGVAEESQLTSSGRRT